MPELDPHLYNVAWIAPLEIEAQSALYMLDERHYGRFPMGRGDDYIFHAGSVSGHNVVIATLPAGQEYGTGSAAALASQVKKSFPNLWFGLLVGVAAGLPDLSKVPPRDIRLGDVLVAHPSGESAALVAYDLGKATGNDEFQPLRFGHVLATTETVVRSAIGSIKLRSPRDFYTFLHHYESMKHMEHDSGTFEDPGQHKDNLYDVFDGQEKEVKRLRRPDSRRNRVWYGPIGSGEKLMRNAQQRNELRDKYDIIGLEMEAAGTMNRIPVGVIRGVCDYGDEHKNKDWQPYAAAMAAAYAKAILIEISPEARVPIASLNPERNETHVSRTERRCSKRPFDDYLQSCGEGEYGYYGQESGHGRMLSAFHSANRQTTQRIDAQQRITPPQSSIIVESCLVASAEAQLNRRWPDYQNERPALAPRFLERHDIPSAFATNSEAWKTAGRRTPWTLVIYGLAGTGKSQLCLKAIMENEKRFRGVFYLDASNNTSATANYLEISRVCGIQSHWQDIELDERIRLTRSWLACHKDPWLLMVDNADSADVTLADYIPTGGPGTIIITTTDERFATYCSAYDKIGPMDEENAIDLLMSYKRPGTALSDGERDTARLLAVELLGGLPLAIAQAGSYIFNKYCTYAEYCHEFRQSPQRPLSYELRQWPNFSNPVWKTFNITISRIEDLPEMGASQAVDLLRTLCFLHHEGIQEQLLREAWGNMKDAPTWSKHQTLLDASSAQWDTAELRAAFEILCRYSLLDHSLPHARQYSMHRLVKVVCRESMHPTQQSRHAVQAMSLMALALLGTRASLPWIENPAGFELQESLLPHLRACGTDRVKSILADQTETDRKTRAEMLLLYSKAYTSTRHYSEARNILEEVCGTSKVNGSADSTSPIILQVMEQTAACESRLGKHRKACELRQKILNAQDPGGENIGDTCVAMMNLADSLWMTGRRKAALEMSQEVLRRREEILTKNDRKLLRTKRKVAEYLDGLNERRQALQLRESVFMDAGLREDQSEIEYLDYLASKSALADSCQWDGQLIRSRQLREDVYQGRLKVLGEDHPDTLRAHDRLLGTESRLLQTAEVRKEVCQKREQLVSTWRQMFGDDHHNTLEARENLGHSYSAMRQWEKALREQRAVLGTRGRHVRDQELPNNEPDYLSSMGNVANILLKMGNWTGALEMRKSALKAAEEAGGANDPMTFKMSHGVASCYASQKTPAFKRTALEMRRSILKRQEWFLKDNHPDILTTMVFLATDLMQSDKETESIALLRDLLKRQKLVLGKKNRQTLDTMKHLSLALANNSSLQNKKEAIQIMEEVEQFESELLGGDNIKVCNTRTELCRLYQNAGENIKTRRLVSTLKASIDVYAEDLYTRSVHDWPGLDIEDNKTMERDTLGNQLTEGAMRIRTMIKRIEQWQGEGNEDGESLGVFINDFDDYCLSSSDKHGGESGSETSENESCWGSSC